MSKIKALKKVVKAQAKRRKKMEAEKPLSARRDMAKRDVSLRKKTEEKDTLTSLGVAGATGAGLTAAAINSGNKKYDNPEDIKNARKAAKKKGSKTFKVDGLTYDTATGDRIPLSLAPSLKALQRRIDYEKSRDKKEKNKKPVKKAKGGMVTKWEQKWG